MLDGYKNRESHDQILLIDDEEATLMSLDTTLRLAGFNNIITCNDSRKASDYICNYPIDLIITDLYMPHVRGDSLLEFVSAEYPDIPVIIATCEINANIAVKCMKAGAADYLTKPIEQDRLLSVVRNAIAFRELQSENNALKQRILSPSLKCPEAFNHIVTQNRHMLSLFQYIESIAAISAPVLITGETGVGKELFAQAIHHLSHRDGNFVAVNAAGLDDTVFSDTLWGHVRGAYTGATHSRAGLIEQAESGTLFLDEIGDLALSAQVKLLRLLQEREYLPLGADLTRKTNARIVTATNIDLLDPKTQVHFRKDLLYRLKPHHIQIPPLRDRLDDLPLLVNHFLEKAANEFQQRKPTAPKELIPLLQTYSFPGNVRELEGMIFDAVSRHPGRMLSLKTFKKHLKYHAVKLPVSTDNDLSAWDAITFPKELPTLKAINELLIDEAMLRAKGVKSIAAQMLGISRQALSKRLRK